ncbi:MAG: sigma-70 family RNA polymerase sigma factor [Oscillospiraceae bacterium]|nr:sigma-70 family RNA polymerase sigma factor [Oscillospiraceae bacterium]
MRPTKLTKLDKAVSDLANGDRSAFSRIYDLSGRLIFSVAYAVVGNYQDAEDVMQDTFLEINKYIHDYKGSGAKAWILTMARHRAIDIVRKRKPHFDLDDFAESPFLSANDDYSRLEVNDMLSRLTEDERQIITYRIYGKLPHREIAEIMGITEANAQKKYRRTIEKLRKVWS